MIIKSAEFIWEKKFSDLDIDIDPVLEIKYIWKNW
jgi:hypothetical protein